MSDDAVINNNEPSEVDRDLAEVCSHVYASLLSTEQNTDLSKWEAFDRVAKLARLGFAHKGDESSIEASK